MHKRPNPKAYSQQPIDSSDLTFRSWFRISIFLLFYIKRISISCLVWWLFLGCPRIILLHTVTAGCRDHRSFSWQPWNRWKSWANTESDVTDWKFYIYRLLYRKLYRQDQLPRLPPSVPPSTVRAEIGATTFTLKLCFDLDQLSALVCIRDSLRLLIFLYILQIDVQSKIQRNFGQRLLMSVNSPGKAMGFPWTGSQRKQTYHSNAPGYHKKGQLSWGPQISSRSNY
jgi:hypothetical protein